MTWTKPITTNSGQTVLRIDDISAVTLDLHNAAGTTYSIHMRSGTIFTTRTDGRYIMGLCGGTMKHPVMK
tara:strand:+ start:24095 stop:24304 length:210 start_codon:yes stop_codon:yes gene_type:complete